MLTGGKKCKRAIVYKFPETDRKSPPISVNRNYSIVKTL